jgi:hypothetical protein
VKDARRGARKVREGKRVAHVDGRFTRDRTPAPITSRAFELFRCVIARAAGDAFGGVEACGASLDTRESWQSVLHQISPNTAIESVVSYFLV